MIKNKHRNFAKTAQSSVISQDILMGIETMEALPIEPVPPNTSEKPNFLVQAKAKIAALLAKGKAGEQKAMVDTIMNLKKRLKRMLLQNEKLDHREKLDRLEFVIDLEQQANLAKKGAENATMTRTAITEGNQGKDLLLNRLKKQFWEPMDAHSTALLALQGDTLCHNFVLRKRTAAEEIVQRRVNLLRKVAMLESKWIKANVQKVAEVLEEVEPGTIAVL